MKTPNLVYLNFFHGRNTPTEHLPDWGSDGPIVGPVEVHFTYGQMRVAPEGWTDEVEITAEEGCFRVGDVYYGDVTVMTEIDPENERVIPFKTLKHLIGTVDYFG